MTAQAKITCPMAREEGLIIEAIGDEKVIYDQHASSAHALKPLAATVFMYSDGSNSVEEIAELSTIRLATEVSEGDVLLALETLVEQNLVEMQELESVRDGLSRRTALKLFAAVGAGSALMTTMPALASATSLANAGKPFVCGAGADLAPITDYSGYNTVKASKAPNGWPQPYQQIGNSSNYEYVTGENPGAPCSPNDYTLGHSCYAAVSGCDSWGGETVYGTYQVVPCDGGYKDSNGNFYECGQVVCVPTNTGKEIGTAGTVATSLMGSISSGNIMPPSDDYKDFNRPGAGGYGSTYFDASEYSGWPFKWCCTGNVCSS